MSKEYESRGARISQEFGEITSVIYCIDANYTGVQ